MKKTKLSTIIIAALIISGSCTHKEHDETAHNHNHAGIESAEHDEHGEEAHDPDEIVLMPEIAARMGVKTKILTAGPFNDVITVSGELLPSPSSVSVASSPTSGILTLVPGITPGSRVNKGQLIATVNASAAAGGNPEEVAAVTLREAKRELDRMTPLHAEGIVSTRDYNAVLKAYEEAKAAYSPTASGGRITAPSSGVITSLNVSDGQYVATGDPVAAITSSSELILRADVPQRESGRLGTMTDANFRLSYGNEWYNVGDLNGRRSAADLSGSTNYVPVYFTFRNPGTLIPGTYAEIRLLGDKIEGQLIIPVTAISEQQGNMYVYVREDEHGYEKRLVTLGADNGTDRVVTSGIKEGEEIVVEGVTAVRLAETSGVVPEGHSHSH